MIVHLVLAAAVAPAPAFAPPIDRPLRYTIVETRTVGTTTRRFEIERSVVFHRQDATIVAELRVVRVDTGTADAIGARFLAGTRALIGRTMRFTLDTGGKILAIDDSDAIWSALTAGVAPLKGPAVDAAASMRAVPAPQRLAILGSMLTPIIAGTTIGPAATHPIRLPGSVLAGKVVMLDGTEAVTRQADGKLRRHIEASGTADAATLAITRETVVDPATGLVLSGNETQRSEVGGRTSIKTTTSTLSPLVS